MIASQTEVVDKLKAGLSGMKDKLSDLKRRRDTLVARAKSAEAQSKALTRWTAARSSNWSKLPRNVLPSKATTRTPSPTPTASRP